MYFSFMFLYLPKITSILKIVTYKVSHCLKARSDMLHKVHAADWIFYTCIQFSQIKKILSTVFYAENHACLYEAKLQKLGCFGLSK